jgi:glycerol-3-phosphate acyltransferase PlsY
MFRLIALGLGYLLGGFQTSILYSRTKGVDIRDFGSGNAGATNTLRIMGKKAALIVFTGDVLKSALAVLIAKILFPQAPLVAAFYAALGAIIGHSYPLFFTLKGGKGIASTVGAIYFINLRIALIATALFFICLFITHIVSLSSMLLTFSLPISVWGFYRSSASFGEVFILSSCIALFTIYRHKDNIKRILKGTEAKLGSKS